ncbi:MAG: hypothetical protein JSV34_04590 [Candidatus Omnitrophota bacterium]|nr:MAG: hypothetical protein JSV34_04590 [Candidatus Omnitrophota bacterium]
MAVKLHFHRHPGCGTTCNSACGELEGICTSCTMVDQGPHKGEYGCVHVIDEKITVEDLKKLVNELIKSFSPQSDKRQQSL